MLSKEQISKIAGILYVKAEDLEAAIASESEATVEIPELKVFTVPELDARDRNFQKQHYDAGKQAGSELLVKELKEKYGIDSEGKDAEKVMDAYKRKIQDEAKVEPSKKVQELEVVISNLKAFNANLEREKADIESRFRREAVKTNVIMGIEKEYLLGKGDMLNLMTSSGYGFEEESGKIVVKLHGNIIRDEKTQDPMPFAAVFDSFAESKRLLKPDEPADPVNPGGRGGGSTRRPSSAFTAMSEFQKHWEAQGKSVNSSDFAAAALKAKEDSGNPDFFKQ